MIPKIIHFFWQSDGPMPEKLRRCVESWKKYCPDYEFRCWNGNSLADNTPLWVTQALEHKKFAFAADYMRYYALFNYGGIYMDTDVELLRPFGDLLNAPYLIGHETHAGKVESGFLAAEKGNLFVKAMLDYYDGRPFVKADGSLDMRPLPETYEEVIVDNGLVWRDVDSPAQISAITDSERDVCVLPGDYFSPLSLQNLKLNITDRTVTIHHFVGSWKPLKHKIKRKVQRFLGPGVTMAIIRLKDVVLNREPK